MTRIVEGEKIGVRSLVGALIAVGGVIGTDILAVKSFPRILIVIIIII